MRLLPLFSVLFALAPCGRACDCAGRPSPCHAVGAAAAVFTGTVVSITSPGSEAWRAGKAGPVKPSPLRLVRFKVDSVLQGIGPAQSEVEVGTGRGGSDCGFLFEVGQQYVVYAYKMPEGWLETGICSRTSHIAHAGQDLAWFRKMEHAPDTGNLTVHAVPKPKETGLPAVIVERDNIRRRAVVDNRLNASFPDLPAGDYTVHIEQDGDRPDDPVVPVRSKGCVDVGFWRSAKITGRLQTKSATPAAGIEVELLAIRPPLQPSTSTNAEGRFEFPLVSPGTYVLGINLTHPPRDQAPYPRWFHPGTSDPAAATRIVVSDKRETQSFDLTVPDRLTPRLITGTVLNADGAPAAEAEVRFTLDSQTLIEPTIIVRNGGFTQMLLSGTRYRVHAMAQGPAGTPVRSAEPVEIPPGTDPVKLVLRLTRTGDSHFDEFLNGLKASR